MKHLQIIFILVFMVGGVLFASTAMPASDKVCENKLVNNLDHEKAQKRADAALELANDGCHEVQGRLLDMALNEDNYASRIVAIVALTRLGDEYTVVALKDCLELEERQTVKTVLYGAINMLENRMLASM